jgi:hypothetical protein
LEYSDDEAEEPEAYRLPNSYGDLSFTRRMGQPKILKFYIPDVLRKLIKRVRYLDSASSQAYETGDYNKAEKLDSLFAKAQEELETAWDEFSQEGHEQRTGAVEDYDFTDVNDLMRQFSNAYWVHNHGYGYEEDGGTGYSGSPSSYEGYVKHLRDLALWYQRKELGKFKENTTDEELVAAAEDSYERMKHLKGNTG